MGVLLKRFPEFGVTLAIYSGAITAEVLVRQAEALTPADAGLWINYLDPTADMSGVDLAHIPAIKRALAAKLREIQGDEVAVSVLVSASPLNEPFVRFWSSYVGLDGHYPAESVVFPSIEAACAWLDLPEAACEALLRAVRTDGPQASPG